MNGIYIEKEDNDILKQECCDGTDEIRKNMVLRSYYKYVPARKNFDGGRIDALKGAKECIGAFKKDKNTEHLFDTMNCLMFRYIYPYDVEHYKATNLDGSVKPVGSPINMEDLYDTWAF